MAVRAVASGAVMNFVGDVEAASLGVDPARSRLVLVLAAALWMPIQPVAAHGHEKAPPLAEVMRRTAWVRSPLTDPDVTSIVYVSSMSPVASPLVWLIE